MDVDELRSEKKEQTIATKDTFHPTTQPTFLKGGKSRYYILNSLPPCKPKLWNIRERYGKPFDAYKLLIFNSDKPNEYEEGGDLFNKELAKILPDPSYTRFTVISTPANRHGTIQVHLAKNSQVDWISEQIAPRYFEDAFGGCRVEWARDKESQPIYVMLKGVPRNTSNEAIEMFLRRHASENNIKWKDIVQFQRYFARRRWSTRNQRSFSPTVRIMVASQDAADELTNTQFMGIFHRTCRFEAYTRPTEFPVTPCYKCCKYGHSNVVCKGRKVCKFCATSHPSTPCPVRDDPSAWKCAACGQNHAFGDFSKCPEHQRIASGHFRKKTGRKRFALKNAPKKSWVKVGQSPENTYANVVSPAIPPKSHEISDENLETIEDTLAFLEGLKFAIPRLESAINLIKALSPPLHNPQSTPPKISTPPISQVPPPPPPPNGNETTLQIPIDSNGDILESGDDLDVQMRDVLSNNSENKEEEMDNTLNMVPSNTAPPPSTPSKAENSNPLFFSEEAANIIVKDDNNIPMGSIPIPRLAPHLTPPKYRGRPPLAHARRSRRRQGPKVFKRKLEFTPNKKQPITDPPPPPSRPTHKNKKRKLASDALTCEKCNERCDTLKELTAHRQANPSCRIYICESCKKGFAQKHHLTRHERDLIYYPQSNACGKPGSKRYARKNKSKDPPNDEKKEEGNHASQS